MPRAVRVHPDGSRAETMRDWVPEAPVALEYNGVSWAVMMATPTDLADFAAGFALTEGLAPRFADIADVAVAEVDLGWIVRTAIPDLDPARLTDRIRARVAESSCGLCGLENLEELARPLPRVAAHGWIGEAAVFAALAALPACQPLGQSTGAAHAAALCAPDGTIRLVREDVGRHNALDKLVGAAAGESLPLSGDLVLSTARCSFEIVEKAVRAGATTLVTISLPTSLAAERAAEAGLSLWALARADSVLLVNDAGLDSRVRGNDEARWK